MAGLADQLHEAMDPEVARTKSAMDEANKAWKAASKVARTAETVHDMLHDVHERVTGARFGKPDSLEQAWDWVLRSRKPGVVGYFAKYPFLKARYKRKAVLAKSLMPTKDEIAQIKAERDRVRALDDEARATYSAASKAHREATGAARRAAKREKEDLLGKAICQSCFGGFNYNAGIGTLVKHGWREAGGRRKGHHGMTWHTGACPGTGQNPFQVDKSFTEHEIVEYGKALKALEAMQRDGVSTEIEVRSNAKYDAGAGYVLSVLRTIKSEAARERAVPRVIEAVIKGVTDDMKTSQQMAKNWKRDEKWIQRTTWPKRAK